MTSIAKIFFYFAFFMLQCFYAHSSDISSEGIDGVSITQSEFYGFGEKNTNYFIKSFESIQKNEDTHSLDKVEGVYVDSDKKDGFKLVADKGTYNSSKKTLNLYKDVKVDFDLGYTLVTEKISIDFNQKIIKNNVITNIIGDNEKTTSKGGFSNNLKTKIIYFSGPVTTILVRQ